MDETIIEHNGQSLYCYQYPHPSVATDNVIFGFDGIHLNVLLIKRGIEPYKDHWALPGGFLKPDETLEQCATRELEEETGLRSEFLQQFHSYSSPSRDPRGRVISIAFVALVRLSDVRGADDAAEARWFPIDKIPALAFDHDQILRDATSFLRERIHFSPIGYDLLPEKFTMKELQALYEAILDIRFDRRNFAKKMLHFEILTRLDETVRPTPKRDATLFRFNLQKYQELKKRGFRLEF